MAQEYPNGLRVGALPRISLSGMIRHGSSASATPTDRKHTAALIQNNQTTGALCGGAPCRVSQQPRRFIMLSKIFSCLSSNLVRKRTFVGDHLPDIESALHSVINKNGRTAKIKRNLDAEEPHIAVYFGCRREAERIRITTIRDFYRRNDGDAQATALALYKKKLHAPNAKFDPRPQ